MMEDGPRYHTVNIGRSENLQLVLQSVMRPGDRIVSVYPTMVAPGTQPHHSAVTRLQVLLELRHPSWAKEGVGWVPGDEAPAV